VIAVLPTPDEIHALAERAVEDHFPLDASPWPRTHPEKSKAGGTGWNVKARVYTDVEECFDFLTRTLPYHNVLIVPGSLHPTNTFHDLVIVDADGDVEVAIAKSLGLTPGDTYTVQTSASNRFHLYYRTLGGFRPEKPCVRIEHGRVTLGSRRIYISELSHHAKTGQLYRALDSTTPVQSV
jgi:hypothetical protein